MSTVLDFWTACRHCGVPSRGRLHFDERMSLRDSDGGLLFMDGWKCHTCLDQPWESADLTVSFGATGDSQNYLGVWHNAGVGGIGTNRTPYGKWPQKPGYPSGTRSYRMAT